MITINTSEVIKYKEAIIDGVELGVRALSSAETLEIMDLQEKVKNENSNRSEIMRRLVDMVFDAFDKPDKAREIMGTLPVDAIFDIYKRIMESE